MRYFLATLSLCALMVTSVLAEGRAEAGAKVFKKCAACHAVGEGAKNKVGPELNAIFGRKVAGVESFNYSPAFKAKAQEGWVWDEKHLTDYLANPQGYIKGTKMAFAGLKKREDLADLLAYLNTFGKP